jgi:hypothetical protein
MSTQHVHDWVQRLQVGTLELFDLEAFEKLRVDELLHDLGPAYPVRFLERQQRSKREVGLAQRQRSGRTKRMYQCLLLTTESNRMTGMAVMTFLRFRPSPQQQGMYDLTSGAGFSLYHDPDGWRIKLLQERTVSLRRKSLMERGWLFLNGNGKSQGKE